MPSQFQKQVFGFRFVNTQRGDTLQLIAARELGDASLWATLISYNNLIPPFLTDDPAQVVPGVLLTGSPIMIPSPNPIVNNTLEQKDIFGTDVQLDADGNIMIGNNDYQLINGPANFKQAIHNRLTCKKGELLFYQWYGSRVDELRGNKNGPTTGALAARYARMAIVTDTRVSKVNNSTATVNGDGINVDVNITAINGSGYQIGVVV